ncbi:hypothetical protein ACL9RL_11070 [Plantibacter sp. Mn2098]|uniref:hypothetical protein n=1 Tax=Plantibacter sp. Mn2098 TaxID=3395266 RepID=UPI003BBC701E
MDRREEANESLPGPPAVETEPEFQPLVPGLERVSHDAFRKGTFSRRRIVRAAIVFVVALVIIGAVVWFARPM